LTIAVVAFFDFKPFFPQKDESEKDQKNMWRYFEPLAEEGRKKPKTDWNKEKRAWATNENSSFDVA
jgi:hypothetical protein